MRNVNWGIIGCGNVTEVKSGPAFNKVPHSQLVAVMRRNEAAARDYAMRHNVPRYYSDAGALLNDPEVNAIYIATPPDTHEAYSLMAMAAGKPVYVEKPMALNQHQAFNMLNASRHTGTKLCVAHYRREQPYFKKALEILQSGVLGSIMTVRLQHYQQAPIAAEPGNLSTIWRLQPAISGGGLFHDLAPHQLDLLLYFFGTPLVAAGFASQHNNFYDADDVVTGHALFRNNVHFTGNWCFNASKAQEADECLIMGSEGSMRLSIFNQNRIVLIINGKEQTIEFASLEHVQQPMIAAVVQYFVGNGPNPCDAHEGYEVMKLIDAFSKKYIPE